MAEFVVERKSRYYLNLIFGGMGKTYWEILRADLNNDGIEDILLGAYSYAIGGTLGFGDVSLIIAASSSPV